MQTGTRPVDIAPVEGALVPCFREVISTDYPWIGYSPSQITRLIRDYQEYGLDAFIAMPHTGKRKYATHKSNFTPERVAELKHRYKTATTKGEARRFKVLLLRSEGYTLKDCALKAGITEAHTFRLVRAYRQNGISAILENHVTAHRKFVMLLKGSQNSKEQNSRIFKRQLRTSWLLLA